MSKSAVACIDSHLHFDVFHEEGEVGAILKRADAAGVNRMVAIGGTGEANRLARDLAVRYPGRIFCTAGYDRDEAGQDPDLVTLDALLDNGGISAVGETGLDYHYSPESADAQKELFQSMLDRAYRHRLPVVVHSREADADTLEMLGAQAGRWNGVERRTGVLHCFTGTAAFAGAVAELGIMISFSGIVTFKNAESIRAAARSVPDELLLVETDAPYLAPVPYRGKRNEPAYVVEVVARLAEIRNCPVEHIADITTRNAEHLFNMSGGAA